MTSVSLNRILEAAASLCGCSEAEIRLGFDERAWGALGVFGWLAKRCSLATDAEMAQHAGRPLWVMCDSRSQLIAAMTSDTALAQRLSDAAVQLVSNGRQHDLPANAGPEEIARRLIMAGPAALTIGQAHIRTLAAAFLSTLSEISDMKEAAHGPQD